MAQSINMFMSYENEYGKILFTFEKNAPFGISDLVGFEAPEKAYIVDTYAMQDGQKTQSFTKKPRVLNIKGYVFATNNSLRYNLEKAVKVFSSSGILKIKFGSKERKIKISQSTFKVAERTNFNISFVVELISDEPNFTEFNPIIQAIMERENIIDFNDSFTFPTDNSGCIFTKFSNNKVIMNNSDDIIIPKIKIYVISKAGVEPTDPIGVYIENKTTGQFCWIEKEFAKGEEISVDFKEPALVSSIDGSIINHISFKTRLDQFWLQKGKNEIAVINYNTDTVITCACEYDNVWMEAIY